MMKKKAAKKRTAKRKSAKRKAPKKKGAKKQGFLDREAEKVGAEKKVGKTGPKRGKGIVSARGRAKMARGARKSDKGTGKGSYGFRA